jgi:hypothetical protein
MYHGSAEYKMVPTSFSKHPTQYLLTGFCKAGKLGRKNLLQVRKLQLQKMHKLNLIFFTSWNMKGRSEGGGGEVVTAEFHLSFMLLRNYITLKDYISQVTCPETRLSRWLAVCRSARTLTFL